MTQSNGDSVDLWRIKYGRSNSNGSGGGVWDYVESQAEAERILLPIAVEYEAHRSTQHSGQGARQARFRAWWKVHFDPKDDSPFRIRDLFSVERLVDGHWVKAEWTLTEPTLTLNAPHSGSSDV